MTTYSEIKLKADAFRMEKKFADAIPFYQQLWNTFPDQFNQWDGWGYAYCLKITGHYEDALQVCRAVFKKHSDFANIKSLYAWCIYYTQLNTPAPADDAVYTKAANAILMLCKQQDVYSPYVITVIKMLSKLATAATYNAEQILQWLEHLDVNLLDKTPYAAKDKSGKTVELASQCEQWYAWKIKALFKLKRYDECILTVDTALAKLTAFHYQNDIWFKRSSALCYANIHQTDKGIAELKNILLGKKEWFIQADLAGIYALHHQNQLAVKYAADAILNYGDIEKKIKVISLFADINFNEKNVTLAAVGYQAVYAIRTAHKWPITQSLSLTLKSLNVAIEKISLTTAIANLEAACTTIKNKDADLFTGVIKQILPNGKAGFIATANRQSYYFTIREFKASTHKLKTGLTVTFYLEDAMDVKKNRAVKNAAGIKPIEEKNKRSISEAY